MNSSSAVRDPVVSEIPFSSGEDELLSQCKHTLEVGVGRLERGLCALAGQQGLLCKCQSAPGGLLLWAVGRLFLALLSTLYILD